MFATWPMPTRSNQLVATGRSYLSVAVTAAHLHATITFSRAVRLPKV